ncbi:hypothetical protein PLANPX_3380 [Lacipirellula parvula]|uniref:Uncharacterized protein n=1 Tax=Lacipirellula parvula TaxID=2650471 RepID=A0A5K7XB96_9BACT|nr:hypothetical protein PLANPX_3380 [Lacipirellula parvula]
MIAGGSRWSIERLPHAACLIVAAAARAATLFLGIDHQA